MDEVGGCCKDGATRAGNPYMRRMIGEQAASGGRGNPKDAEAAPTSARISDSVNMTRARMSDIVIVSTARQLSYTRNLHAPAVYERDKTRTGGSSISTYLKTLATKCLLHSSPDGPASGTSVCIRARTVKEEPGVEKEGANVPRAGERMSSAGQTSGVDMFPALPRSRFLAHAHSRSAHFSCGPQRPSCGICTASASPGVTHVIHYLRVKVAWAMLRDLLL